MTTYRTYCFVLVFTPWKQYSNVEEALKQEKPRRVPVCVLQKMYTGVFTTRSASVQNAYKYVACSSKFSNSSKLASGWLSTYTYILYWYQEDTKHKHFGNLVKQVIFLTIFHYICTALFQKVISVPDLWHFVTDSDPHLWLTDLDTALDPALSSSSDLQDTIKK